MWTTTFFCILSFIAGNHWCKISCVNKPNEFKSCLLAWNNAKVYLVANQVLLLIMVWSPLHPGSFTFPTILHWFTHCCSQNRRTAHSLLHTTSIWKLWTHDPILSLGHSRDNRRAQVSHCVYHVNECQDFPLRFKKLFSCQLINPAEPQSLKKRLLTDSSERRKEQRQCCPLATRGLFSLANWLKW